MEGHHMTEHSGPLYLRSTWQQDTLSVVGASLNLICAAWCVVWIVRHGDPVRPGIATLVCSTIVGLFLADLFSGLIHWGTDTWFDEILLTRLVSIAREHHVYPHHIVGYGLIDYFGYSSWP